MEREEMRSGKKQNRLFYGWVVCGMCLLLIFITMGTASNAQSIFMPYFMKEFGLTNSQTSSLVTLRCTMAFLSMFFIGKYYELVGYRIGTAVAALLCGCSYFIFSLAESYFVFCIGAAISGLSYGLGTMIPVSILMNRWFFKHRALAIGICSSGSGLAVIIMPTILTGIIETVSLDAALLFVTSYIVVFSILIFIFISDRPEKKGLEPYGRDEMRQEQRLAENPEVNRLMKSYGFSRSQWIMLGTVALFMGAVANPGFVHLTVLYTSEGLKPMTIAMLISVAGILIAVFKIIFGQFTDMVGGFRSSLVFMGFLILGHLLCCFAFTQSVFLATASCVFLGMGYAVATIGIPVWTGDMASPDRYADTVRKLQMAYAAGAMLFASIPGIMADAFGSYISAYMLLTGMMILAVIMLIISYQRRRIGEVQK